MIASTLAALYPDAPTLELRVFVNGHIDSGYFNDYAALERAALNYQKIRSQVYFTLNPCKAELIARASNRVESRTKETTTDKDIATRRYLPLDFDPIRVAGISATDKERASAHNAAKRARAYLAGIGWPQPIELDSGNGAYLVYRIDLPNDPESAELVKTILHVCDHLFSDEAVKVDTSMYNASRIVRLPGTRNTKGDSTEDRPHRQAQVIHIPDALVTVDRKLLENLAAMLPQPPKPEKLTQRIDIGAWLVDQGFNVIKKDRWDSAIIYTLERCAFDPNHTNGSAAILQYDNGGYQYKCFHDSCSSNGWKQFVKLHPLPGTDKSKSAKIIAALNGLGYFFRLNECADRIEVNGSPITNPLAAKLRVLMADRNVKPASLIEDAYHANALENSYHPVKEYLGGLEYDPTRDYIRELAECLHDIHAPIGNDTVAYTWLKHWLIGSVAKVYEAEQNPMLVLVGEQRIGKSTFARWLASGLPNFFIEGGIDPQRADDKLRLIQAWIWEVAELGATTRKADVEALKHFITTRWVTVRRPYDKYDMHKPAQASLIGTINPDGSGFLADGTGNRRFLTMTLSKIDYAYTQLPIDRIWAQAVHYYRTGVTWLLPEDGQAEQAAINKAYEIEDPYADLLQAYFTISPDDHTLWTPSLEILRTLQEREPNALRGELKRQSMDLSKACNKLGLKRERRNNVYGYCGIVPQPTIKLNFVNKRAEVK